MGYRVYGQGPPLLLIMGFGGTKENWDPTFLAQLATQYQVITFDNRGIGDTTVTPGPYLISQFADDSAGLLQALGINHAAVLGFSMGSYIAQELVLRHPDLVSSLVLYGTDCGGSDAVRADPAVLKTLVDTSGTPAAYLTRLLNIFLPGSWLADPANVHYAVQVFEQSGASPSPQTISLQAQAVLSWSGTCDRLQNVTQDTLVMAGSDDEVIPPANASIVAAHLSQAQVKIFPGGGHFMMMQFPADLANAVLAFLSAQQP